MRVGAPIDSALYPTPVCPAVHAPPTAHPARDRDTCSPRQHVTPAAPAPAPCRRSLAPRRATPSLFPPPVPSGAPRCRRRHAAPSYARSHVAVASAPAPSLPPGVQRSIAAAWSTRAAPHTCVRRRLPVARFPLRLPPLPPLPPSGGATTPCRRALRAVEPARSSPSPSRRRALPPPHTGRPCGARCPLSRRVASHETSSPFSPAPALVPPASPWHHAQPRRLAGRRGSSGDAVRSPLVLFPPSSLTALSAPHSVTRCCRCSALARAYLGDPRRLRLHNPLLHVPRESGGQRSSLLRTHKCPVRGDRCRRVPRSRSALADLARPSSTFVSCGTPLVPTPSRI